MPRKPPKGRTVKSLRPQKKKDWYGLSVRVDKKGERHLSITKNSGDRTGYQKYLKQSKTYQQSLKKKK